MPEAGPPAGPDAVTRGKLVPEAGPPAGPDAVTRGKLVTEAGPPAGPRWCLKRSSGAGADGQGQMKPGRRLGLVGGWASLVAGPAARAAGRASLVRLEARGSGLGPCLEKR